MESNRGIPFAKITIPFIIGIIAERHFIFSIDFIVYVAIILFCSYFFLHLFIRSSLLKRYSLSFIVSTFIFCSGSITANQQHQLNYNSTICEATLVRGVVTDIKKHTDSIITFEFDIKTYKTKESWHNLNHDEKVLVYLKKKNSTF